MEKQFVVGGEQFGRLVLYDLESPEQARRTLGGML